jgi:hypothetical protein
MKPSDSAVSQPVPHAIAPPLGMLARIRRALNLEPPSREEIRRRVRSKPGIFDSLSPEALEYLRNYDGPENSGPPLTRRERRLLAERLSNK